MAKKTKAQNKGQNQRASEAPVSEEILRAVERIGYDPTKREATAFSGENEVNPRATLPTLVAALYEAPNGPSSKSDDARVFMQSILLCAADDFAILRDALIGTETGVSEYMARFLLRAEWRVHIGLEFCKRFAASAESESVVAP
jgi:hypothetical protein